MKPGTVLSVVVFVLVALAHVLRLALQVPVTVGPTEVPLWTSGAGVVVPLALAWLLAREGRMILTREGPGATKQHPAPN